MVNNLREKSMNEIRFIKDLSWNGQIMAKGRENGRNPLFIRQGDLDGACAVYSLMMMLMIHRKINRRELEDRKAAKNNTDGGYNSYMRLQDQFLGGLKGLYKDGYYFRQLAEELHSCFKDKATAAVIDDVFGKRADSKEKQGIAQAIMKTLQNGYPVEIGFSRRRGCGHAVVAVGYTTTRTSLRLFCLDPGFDISKIGFWNSIIDIHCFEPSSAIYSDLYYTPDGNCSRVTVDEILTIND